MKVVMSLKIIQYMTSLFCVAWKHWVVIYTLHREQFFFADLAITIVTAEGRFLREGSIEYGVHFNPFHPSSTCQYGPLQNNPIITSSLFSSPCKIWNLSRLLFPSYACYPTCSNFPYTKEPNLRAELDSFDIHFT